MKLNLFAPHKGKRYYKNELENEILASKWNKVLHENQISVHESHAKYLQSQISQLEFERKRILTDFRIKRFIIGKRGSGKTHFIKTVIIPQLNGNYFIIDVNSEYGAVPQANRLDCSCKPIDKIRKELMQVIEKIKGTSMVLIVEDVTRFYDSGIPNFMASLMDLNFILVFHGIKNIQKHLDYVSHVYDFGTMDVDSTRTTVQEKYPEKVIDMKRCQD